ncbi:MAG TPA: YciI family protein [Lacunisphaera sp.]|nr:YciI family protein [Lacunisphaera sp.]
MKFICLGYFNKAAMDALPRAEVDALMRQCGPYLDDLYGSGRIVVDVGLEQPATTVRTVKGKLQVTDGPFAETKEVLGGVSIIEAANREEAIQLAARHPAARMGEEFGWRQEVRALHTFKQF